MTALLIANLVVSSLILVSLVALGFAAVVATRRKRVLAQQLHNLRAAARKTPPVSKEQVADFMARARARQAK